MMKISRQNIVTFIKNILQVSAIFLVVYTAVNYFRQPVMPLTPVPAQQMLSGQSMNLLQESYKRPILVYFWATWCHYCRVTTPRINELAKENYSIVSIAVTSGSDQEVQQYLQQHHYNFPVINDQQGQLFKQWQGKVTPSFVILKDGKVVQGMAGLQPAWSLKLRLWLASI